MILQEAKGIAEKVLDELSPHCTSIAIAGSIRRKKPEVKDIEIVAIPLPYDVGIFQSGIATVIEKWHCVRGNLPCKYTQRILPEQIKLDIFFTDKLNWGYIFAIRTGSAAFSHKVLARRWVELGYKGKNGQLHRNGQSVPVPEEEDLFKILGLTYLPPERRSM